MTNNYNILAKNIVKKYVRRVSGSDITGEIIEDDPSKRVMVGMLSENRVQNSLTGGYKENSETRFESVPSLSLSFIVDKKSEGNIHIIPEGLLFYTVNPDYDKTVEHILKTWSEKDKIEYKSISELCEKYSDQRFQLPKTYKTVEISKYMGDGIIISRSEFKDVKMHLEQAISEKLTDLADSIMNEIRIVPALSISFFDLMTKDKFIAVSSAKEEYSHPNWSIDVFCSIIEEGDSFRFLLQMVNNTVVGEIMDLGYIPKVFNAGIRVRGDKGIIFKNIDLDYFKNSYKERENIYAISENTSVRYDEISNEIYTDNVPVYYQKRLRTKDQYNEYITFDNLIKDPVSNLSIIYEEMKNDYNERELDYKNIIFATDNAKKIFEKDLETYKQEIARFECGIKQIEYKDWVKKAFVYMNKTFGTSLNENQRNYSGWRLFQIVFIVSLISEMIRSEYRDDPTLASADIETANLLYFPTGGGKTEAFLGCCVFAMFFDRLRGKNYGLTAMLKYPLRLLAVQQLDRVLVVVMKANKVREESEELKNTHLFEVGFFVGSNNTPNKISSQETLSDRGQNNASKELIIDSDEETLNEYYRFIDTCPVCGKKMIKVNFNRDTWKLEHVCTNPECKVKELPLLIVDREIFRYLPSIVVSTIDKMAMLGITNEFKMLFGQVKKWCPVHGFSCQNKCLQSKEGCTQTLRYVNSLKDPIPTLFIQDEMHLVKESLGTFDSHYESFVDYYSKNLVPKEQQKQIRFIGATATISMYEEHINNLYHMAGRRFPCEYPSVESGNDFYSYTDENDITRIILGYAPYGRSITNGMWESVYIMRTILYSYMQDLDVVYEELLSEGFSGTKDELRSMLYDYWIELVYNNRKQDAMELENSLQNQGNNYLEAKGIPKFEIKQMTSDVDFQTVRKTLFDIQSNRGKLESTNLLLATSTISHGVDEDSFNIMYFFGMPNNNAEYIQAYSRTGRKYTGIVIDIIRLMRIRDRSYLKNFVIFHQNKDDLVEAVPINRWAKNAIYSTLPGILSALLIQYYTIKNNIDNLYKAVDLKKLLSNQCIDKEEVIRHIIASYGCRKNEKLSLSYVEVICNEVRNILDGIENGNFTNDENVSSAIARFSHGKKAPMLSLRDTEETIEIKI